MKKLLVICPSRGRPERIKETLDSIESTCDFNHTDFMVLLDDDDYYLEDYTSTLPSWVKVKIYSREMDCTLTTEIINRAFKEFNDYEFYSVTNDDIVYKNKGWDIALCQKLKISCGQDDTMVEKYGTSYIGNVNPGEFPITSVIDGDIVRKIGWLQYPKLRHSCGDNIWFWIGKRSDCLYFDGKYHTDHNSAYFGRGEADETFNNCNAYNNKQDYYAYKNWLKYGCGRELVKMEQFLKINFYGNQFGNRDTIVLTDLLNKYKPKKICEIGCWTGGVTSIIGKYAKKNNAKIYCIDLFKGSEDTDLLEEAKTKDIKKVFLNNIDYLGLKSHVKLIVGDSAETSKDFEDNFFDFIFIDADHRYSKVLKDIESWIPKVNGVLCGHDFDGFEYDEEYIERDFINKKHHGVIKAVTEKFNEVDKFGTIWVKEINN